MSTLVAPHVHLWTRNEYHQMAELGWFARQRVELIEGQVIDMSPMGSEHATAVVLTAKAVEQVFGTGYFVRWQMPFGVGELSEPEPDVAVIAGDIRDYTTEHPTSAVLIVAPLGLRHVSIAIVDLLP
jgi:Uma2 family endonuclease